jgi:hypothetical protein
MTSPPLPPQDPLDAQERELARILRALPGGEPPAALDAKILRAATNAAASSRRPGARLLASAGAMWGIGSAAAAVLALGVAWQLRYGQPDGAPTESAPRAQAASDVAEDDAMQVEFGERSSVPLRDMPPPPAQIASQPAAAAPAAESRLRRQESRPAPASAPPPPPAPEAFAADQLDEHVAREAAAANLASEAEAKADGELAKQHTAYGQERDAAAKSAAQGAAQAAPAPAMAAEPQPRADLGAASAVGGLAAPADAPPAKPATWLAEVRRLRDAGKIAEARARLVEFRRVYPNWVIPTDLAPLLTE